MSATASPSTPTSLPASPAVPVFTPAIRLYLWLSGVFVTCLLLANILGVKLFSFPVHAFGVSFKVEHTVGMLTFPITFLLTDLLNEYYGTRAARRVAYVGFVMGMLAFVLIWMARQFPILAGIPGTATHEAFENIFGSASLMYLASMAAFLLGSLLDIFLFRVFKTWTGGKLVWFRATGSTVVSQLFDSFLVTFLFFWLFPNILGREAAAFTFVMTTALTGYVLKFVISVVLTPGIYLGRWMIREWVGLQPLPPEHKD
jgi:hypothetical protein